MNFAPSMSFANQFSVNRLLPSIPDRYLAFYSILFVAAIMSFTARNFIDEPSLTLAYLLDIASCITCGIAWLLARGLFKPSGSRANWPVNLVASFFVFSVTLHVADHLGATREGIFGFLGRVNLLIGSTVLVLPIFEALDGIKNEINRQERTFRITFLSGYVSLILISFIVALPGFGPWEIGTQLILSWVALAGGMLAVWFRLNHPLANESKRKSLHSKSLIIDPTLGPKILETLQTERIFLDSQIKISDLANRLKEPDYKVTQAITNDLGFKNFNQMMNSYRIQEAIRLLSDLKYSHCSILSIAMNSGFGSIGPFNRAFKDQTETTPRAFRREQILGA